MYAAPDVSLFDEDNPRSAQKRKLVAFRCPDDLSQYLDAAKNKGHKLSQAIVRMLYIAKEAADEANGQYKRIAAWGEENNLSEGRALAKLALAGLDALEREAKKKK